MDMVLISSLLILGMLSIIDALAIRSLARTVRLLEARVGLNEDIRLYKDLERRYAGNHFYSPSCQCETCKWVRIHSETYEEFKARSDHAVAKFNALAPEERLRVAREQIK